MNSRYKVSITKTTRGWKEKLFARNSPTPEQPTPQVRRDSGQGIATVSQMIGDLEVTEEGRTSNSIATLLRNSEDSSSQVSNGEPAVETSTCPSLCEHEMRPPCAAGSASF